MNEPPLYINNFEAIVSAFGYWPSFHDAPVRAFEHTRENITLTLHAWEMTSQTDEKGYFILRNHHLVCFKFSGIKETKLEQFIPENILFELVFSPVSDFEATGQFTVVLDSAMGGDLCGSFTATYGEVTAVTACDKN